MSPVDIDAVIRRAQNRTCRTRMADGFCGQPATATIDGIPVCAGHAEAAAPILDCIRQVMEGGQ
jgi:hypothetical protein